MGYDIHITRAENWFENQGFDISGEEWLTVVRNDPELIPIPENGQYFVTWNGSKRYSETWFDWSNGNIFTKAPDRATLRKMLQIAQQLNAKVQGDEGELYGEKKIRIFDDSFLNKEHHSKRPKIPLFFLIACGLILIPFIFFLIWFFIYPFVH